jgi:hypothetical protein
VPSPSPKPAPAPVQAEPPAAPEPEPAAVPELAAASVNEEKKGPAVTRYIWFDLEQDGVDLGRVTMGL